MQARPATRRPPRPAAPAGVRGTTTSSNRGVCARVPGEAGGSWALRSRGSRNASGRPAPPALHWPKAFRIRRDRHPWRMDDDGPKARRNGRHVRPPRVRHEPTPTVAAAPAATLRTGAAHPSRRGRHRSRISGPSQQTPQGRQGRAPRPDLASSRAGPARRAPPQRDGAAQGTQHRPEQPLPPPPRQPRSNGSRSRAPWQRWTARPL